MGDPLPKMSQVMYVTAYLHPMEMGAYAVSLFMTLQKLRNHLITRLRLEAFVRHRW